MVPHKSLDFQKCSTFPGEIESRWRKHLDLCPVMDCSILSDFDGLMNVAAFELVTTLKQRLWFLGTGFSILHYG